MGTSLSRSSRAWSVSLMERGCSWERTLWLPLIPVLGRPPIDQWVPLPSTIAPYLARKPPRSGAMPNTRRVPSENCSMEAIPVDLRYTGRMLACGHCSPLRGRYPLKGGTPGQHKSHGESLIDTRGRRSREAQCFWVALTDWPLLRERSA